MKKLSLCIALTIVLSTKMFGQDFDTTAFYQKNKVELSQIYLQEVNRVVKKMPNTAFDSALVDVPKSKYLNKKFVCVNKKIAKYNETLLKEYAEIIPYADKKELIEAIIYLKKL
jgi:hypothetical protein